MLTCEFCGEEVMLEEDMKTHLLLSHQENLLLCPLCSLSAVTYHQLSHHITSAHPEEPQHANVSPQRSAQHTSPSTSGLDTRGSGRTEEDAGGTQSEPPPALKEFSCPMCPVVCSSSFLLHQHVELHLQSPRSAEDERRSLECPVCAVVCRDSATLQEHVGLHWDDSLAGDSAESLSSDLKMAIQLQQAEEENRRQEEAYQEREEFKKLQRRFGLGGGGGYCQQVERRMEKAVAGGLMTPADYHCQRVRMMESLATGVDDEKTKTKGVLSALFDYYQRSSRDHAHVWLSADTDHYCSSTGDKGWGCGYRNFQMLLASLHRIDGYAPVLHEKTVPNIPRLQRMVEEAWKEGVDPQGASHFKQNLQRSRAWIGATEIYTLLTSLSIRARIIDFHQPTGPGNTHPLLLDWVKRYFCSSSRPTPLTQTSLPPLYLQYQGHSCSIVGLEQKKNGSMCILLLDPSSSVSEVSRLFHADTVSSAVRHLRRFPRNLKQRQYQVVAAEGLLSSQDKQVCILNSRTLQAERIP